MLYWRLSDGDTTVAHDSSGWGNDGDVAGLGERYDGATEQPEGAPFFPGLLDDYVRLGTFDEMGAEEFSIAFWVRPRWSRRTVLSYSVPAASGASIEEQEAAANEISIVAPNGTSLRRWTS